jgi:serine O-acetyltransferase
MSSLRSSYKQLLLVYPVIDDDVVIYANFTIVGKVKIDKNGVIGAKTLVNIDVPPNSLAVGTPCKIIHTK